MIVLLPRKSRKNLRGNFFHVMVQGVNKEYIFEENKYKERYIKLIKNAKKYDIEIIAFCIMDNHAHLLIYTLDTKKLSEFMWKINFEFARYYNEKEKRIGVVFRNRYRLEEIYNEKYLLNCISYIHNNPINAGIVKHCEDYKYSSYMEVKAKNKYRVECLDNLKENTYKRFIDIKEDEETIKEAIYSFFNKKEMNLSKLKEDKKVLKQLVKYIKNRCNVSNSEISKILNISKTTVWNYLNKD